LMPATISVKAAIQSVESSISALLNSFSSADLSNLTDAAVIAIENAAVNSALALNDLATSIAAILTQVSYTYNTIYFPFVASLTVVLASTVKINYSLIASISSVLRASLGQANPAISRVAAILFVTLNSAINVISGIPVAQSNQLVGSINFYTSLNQALSAISAEFSSNVNSYQLSTQN